MVLNQAPVADRKEQEAEAKRTLAYEQAISQPRKTDDAGTKGKEQAESEKKDIPDFETVTSGAVPENAGDPPAVQDIPPDSDGMSPQDMAALPDDGVPPLPGTPGSEQWETDGAEQWGDERASPDPYASQGDPNAPPADDRYARQADPYGDQPGDPYREDEPYDPYAPDPYAAQGDPYGAPPGDPSVPRRYGDPNGDPYAAQREPYGQGDPYAQGDPYGAQQQQPWGTDQNGEEWVQVIVSGSPMRATASEDAPMLFAFPYGRNLKVVSRYEGWVEVTDPDSSATGWMQAHALGPSAPPGQNGYGQGQAYYDEEPRERPGIFRRGGLADIINRAFGGGGN